ncbi:PKD domain-containing protein [Longispora sp. K20-0274]|uniref:PKD domain-containing protein n=1 Tax=Longispora sp. K20-0274 TaxID=3088255 RepID=UPI00399B90D9
MRGGILARAGTATVLSLGLVGGVLSPAATAVAAPGGSARPAPPTPATSRSEHGSPPASVLAHPTTGTWPFGTNQAKAVEPSALRKAMTAATAAARKKHAAVPVEAATTAYTTMVANPDGSFTARQDLQPQRARRGDAWVPIDTTLTTAKDGSVRPRASAVAMVFSGGGTGPAATQDDGSGHVLTFTWPTALPKPTVRGSVATYRDVYPGVDLQLEAQPGGLRNLFVIRDAKAAASPAVRSLGMGVTGTGLTLSADDGAVQAKDAAGHKVFDATSATMWDSATGTAARSPHVAAVPARVTGQRVEVAPDQGMLTSASTVWPVTVAPPGPGLAQDWTELWSNGTTVHHGYPAPYGGYDTRAVRVGNNGSVVIRSLLSFDATTLPRPGTPGNEALFVVAADLHLKRQPTASGSCVNTAVWRANPFNDSSNWGNQNGGTNTNLWPSGGVGTDGASWSNPIGYTASCASNPDWSVINITGQVRDVYNWGGSTYTLGLRASNEGPTSGNYGSFNVQNGDGGNTYVSITYVAEPSFSGSMVIGNTVTGNHDTRANPCGPDAAHPGYLPMQTGLVPASVQLSEPDPGRWVQYSFGMNDLTDPSSGTQTSSMVATNAGSPIAQATLSKAVSTADANGYPSGTALQLKDGHKYEIFAQAMDDVDATIDHNGQYLNPYGRELDNAFTDYYNNKYGNTGNANYPTSNVCYFIASTTVPQPVAFTSQAFPPAGQHLPSYPPVGTSDTITVSSTATGTPIVRFDYAINTDSTNEGADHCPTTSKPDACGTFLVTPGLTASAPIKIPADATRWGNNHIYVTAIDAAGNSSQFARYDFFLSQVFQPVSYGDVTGDGVPDVMAVDGGGNLVAYPTNLDPSPGAANAVRAAPASAAPNGTSWSSALYAHRGAIRVQPTDDLLAWDKDANGTGHLFYYNNAQVLSASTQPGYHPPTTPDAFVQSAQSEITRPSCNPSNANGYCAGYDQASWSNVVQVAAIGPVLGGCDITAPTVACKTNVITVETDPAGGPAKVWMFSPVGVGRLANPVLLSTSTSTWHWETTKLLSPGNAAGHAGGPGGMPDLWARDADGTLWQFTNTSTPTTPGAGLADLTHRTQLGQFGEFGKYKWINTAGDLNADGKPDVWTMDLTDQMGVVFSPIGTPTGNGLATQAQDTATPLRWAAGTAVASVQGSAVTPGIAGQLVTDQTDGNNPSRQLCVDDLNGGLAEGATVDVYTCNGTGAQQWYFAPDGTIRTMGQTPMCLSPGGSLLLGAKIGLHACAGDASQVWRAVPSPSTPGRYSLYHPASGLCLDDTGYSTVNGTQFELWQCWDPAAQRFTLPSGPNQTQTAEAESLLYDPSGVTPTVQTGCCGVGWSNNAQLMVPNTAVNSSVTLNYYVANAGTYQLTPTMTRAVDYGKVTALVDNVALPNVFDGYHNGVDTLKYFFGSVHLSAGNHAFTFKVTGTNGSSTGNRYNAGIDTLALVPTTGLGALAALSLDKTSGSAPLAVTADASGSVPGGAAISSYTFDFGDGRVIGPQTGRSTTHTYTVGGTYVVRVTVTDAAGATSSATAPVSIVQPNLTAALTTSQPAPLTATADASGSTAGANAISTYTFDFGDGTTVGPQSGATATHAYAAAGTYTVTVTIRDTASATASTSAQVTVSASTATPAYVGRVGTASGSNTVTSVTVKPGGVGVKAGDTLLVSAMLSNIKATGPVSVTDTQGNVYTSVFSQASTVNDSTAVFASTNVKALTSADTITVTFPSTGYQNVAVDEFSGVTAVDQHSSATATDPGNTTVTFNSGNTPTTTAANELVFGVFGVHGGSNATWAAGYTALPTVFVSTIQLGTAYRSVTATGAYNASGTAYREWMSGVVTLR